MSIKNWPLGDRPIEKLQQLGAPYLSDTELLSILVATGSARGGLSAVTCSRLLLRSHSTLRGLSRASPSELCRFPGIGPVKASRILAAFELSRRLAGEKTPRRSLCGRSQDVFEAYSVALRDEKKEAFLVLLLDSKNRFIREERISVGSLNCSIVHPREVFHPAIRECAASVLFVHNHPSGDPSPSDEDKQLTQRLLDVARLLGIRVLDHIIIGDGSYYSFFDEGMMVP